MKLYLISFILIQLLIISHINSVKIRSHFSLNYQTTIKKNNQNQEAKKEDEQPVNEKLVMEEWIHYIKYRENTVHPQKFFRNPSYETQIKYEGIDNSTKNSEVRINII